jgi:hypothetical protein
MIWVGLGGRCCVSGFRPGTGRWGRADEDAVEGVVPEFVAVDHHVGCGLLGAAGEVVLPVAVAAVAADAVAQEGVGARGVADRGAVPDVVFDDAAGHDAAVPGDRLMPSDETS